MKVHGYGTNHSFTGLKPMTFDRPEAKPNEVTIEVLYCGVCHSDVHQIENDWHNTVYPCVPGHEIVGRVKSVGASVSRHQVGDLVGVGCMIDSCRECAQCRAKEEQYCEGPNSWLATYNGPMKPAAKAKTKSNMYDRDNTFGGYSEAVIVPEDFVLKIPANLPIERAAPILCAGVTTYSPLKHWGVKAGSKVAIAGFGGLGDMATKLAVAMGADVTVLTSTKEKIAEAQKLGAKAVLEDDSDALDALEGTFDLILATIPEKFKVDPFVKLLGTNGNVVIVGALDQMPAWNHMEMAMHRRTIAGSLIGSIAETQEVLDFCAAHGITPDVEMLAIQDINDAYKKVKDGEVRFRYVIDMASLKKEVAEA